MKSIVETSGSFELLVPETKELVPYDRPAVVTNAHLITSRIALGQVKLLAADVPPEASDEEFVKYWEENPEIAVDAYLSQFGDIEQEPLPMAELEEALTALTENDFQADGKPKVGALDALVDMKVTKKIRDSWWESRE